MSKVVKDEKLVYGKELMDKICHDEGFDYKEVSCKGQRLFSLRDDSLGYQDTELDCEFMIYDLMTGEDFLECVRSHCITDYDGILSEIIVDGYISNLGLNEEDLRQGAFLVDGDTFKSICDECDVYVNWANK